MWNCKPDSLSIDIDHFFVSITGGRFPPGFLCTDTDRLNADKSGPYLWHLWCLRVKPGKFCAEKRLSPPVTSYLYPTNVCKNKRMSRHVRFHLDQSCFNIQRYEFLHSRRTF